MTAHETKTIDHATLAERAARGAIRGARVVGQPGGWGLVVKDGRTARSLAARRGEPRVFRRFETLVGYLKDIGIVQYDVDASGYAPDVTARRRPDTAKRMERAHEAADHDRWFRAQVQDVLDGLERGEIGVVSQTEHARRWQRKRKALLARARR
jgi:hypothetical protein